ncbi:MAG TPA: caspase family protein, partial [Phytomonospora sp.]
MAGRSEEPYSDSEGGPEFPDHEVSSSFGTKGGEPPVADEVFEPRLADPARSRVVLIGSASYADFENLPAVAAGVRDLAALFTTAALWGLPAENLTIHLDTSLVEAMAAVRKAAAEAEDAILVYFAGHGVRGPDGELKLAFQDSVVTATETMLPFRYLQEAMAGSRAGTRAMILDCSYAGAADPQRGITHLLAAAGAVIQARAGSGGAHTAFTGELISALAQGVRGGPELLHLDQVGREVTRRCERKALPI